MGTCHHAGSTSGVVLQEEHLLVMIIIVLEETVSTPLPVKCPWKINCPIKWQVAVES